MLAGPGIDAAGSLGVAGFAAGPPRPRGRGDRPNPGPHSPPRPTRAGRSSSRPIQDKKKEHRWRLKSSNGQVIATSGQGYKDKRDCDSAIERIKKDAATKLKFETYEDAKNEYRWRLKATNGQIIASSGQGYKDKRDCEHAIDVIKKGAEKAKVEEASE